MSRNLGPTETLAAGAASRVTRTGRMLRTAALTGATTAALALSLAGVATAQTTADAPPARARTTQNYQVALTADRYENQIGAIVNNVRARHGLRPVAVRACTDGFAERWTRHLVRNGVFEHQSLGPIMERCNLSGAGEVLALGSVTPGRMIRMWLGSPGHRAIMLDPHYRIMGSAAVQDANGSWIGCIDFGLH